MEFHPGTFSVLGGLEILIDFDDQVNHSSLLASVSFTKVFRAIGLKGLVKKLPTTGQELLLKCGKIS